MEQPDAGIGLHLLLLLGEFLRRHPDPLLEPQPGEPPLRRRHGRGGGHGGDYDMY